jgi:hypothetical protein
VNKKHIVLAIGAVAAALTMSGCTTAAPAPDVMTLHYRAGEFSSTEFGSCVEPGTRAWNGPGDRYYSYPVSLRFWDATGGDNADAPQITSVSDDNAEMLTPVIVNFTMINDCELIRKFHETIGNRSSAYLSDENASTSDGWFTLLGRIMGKPLDTIVDRVAQQYDWREMWNSPEIRKEMESQILEELPGLVSRQTDGVQYFQSWAVTVNQPTPKDEELLALARAEQKTVAEANSIKAKAEADTASAKAQAALAEAQIATAKAEAEKKQAEIAGYPSVDDYLKSLAIQNGISPWATTTGTGTVNTSPSSK